MYYLSHNSDLGIVRCVSGDADLESIGALLADKTRATIMSTLPNGDLTAASVLADRAGVSRPLARVCADWSEQRQHLAGSLGGAFTSELLRRGWVVEALTTRLGVDPAALPRAPERMEAA